jgi:hypothetical protein
MQDEPSSPFGNLPNGAAPFGILPHPSEDFRNVPQSKEKTIHHILTVHEVARRFEDAGAARTERSIINWCNPNKHGLSRLDCYYEPNERKYFITPQSTARAIEEELAKTKTSDRMPHPSVPFGNLPHISETATGSQEQEPQTGQGTEATTQRLTDLEKEVLDLKITNRAKDYFIDQLKEDREHFAKERAAIIAQVAESARKIGQLETKLLQLEAPQSHQPPAGQSHDAEFTEAETEA